MTPHVSAAAFLMGILLPGQADLGAEGQEAGMAGGGSGSFDSLLAGLASEEGPAGIAPLSPSLVPGEGSGTDDARGAPPDAMQAADPAECGPAEAAAEGLLALPLTVALPAPVQPGDRAAAAPTAATATAPAAAAPMQPVGEAPAMPMPTGTLGDAAQPEAAASAPQIVPAAPVAGAAGEPAQAAATAAPAHATSPASAEPLPAAAPLTAPAAEAPVGDNPPLVLALQALAAVRGSDAAPATATLAAPANDATEAIVLPAAPVAQRVRHGAPVMAEPAEVPARAARPSAGFSTMLLAQAANDDAPVQPAGTTAAPQALAARAAAVPAMAEGAAVPAPTAGGHTATAFAPASNAPSAAPAAGTAHPAKAAEANAPETAQAVVQADVAAPQATALPAAPAAAIRAAAEPLPGATTARALPHAAVDQVTVAVRRALDGGSDRIRVQLWPENLGHVDVTLRLHDDGRVSAAIAVDRPETLDLFHQESRGLERAFEQAGFRTEAGDVSLSLRQGNGQAGFAFAQDQGRHAPQQAESPDPRRAGEAGETAPQPRRDASRVVDIHA